MIVGETPMGEPQWSGNPARARWARGLDGSNASAPDTVMTDEVSMFSLGSAIWTREVISRGFRFVRTTTWMTDAKEMPAGAEYLARHDGHSEAVWCGPEGLTAANVSLNGGQAHVRVAGRSADLVEALLARLRADLRRVEIGEDDPRVPVMFWSLSQQGPTARMRQITVPPWSEIEENYPSGVGDELARVAGPDFQPGAGGQLLLWHGPPGTGKTWALRALAWEWRAWCDLHYVTDPEVFFGDRASYMLDVLLHDDGDGLYASGKLAGAGEDPDAVAEEPRLDPRAAGGRWKLLVLEDTGELMSADARDRSGQGLSRLLNVVDGLIGQGLKVLVLVTTNEELQTLHPAVQRPGRCASKILFGAFGSLEAERWLRDRGVEEVVLSGPRTVADLFAVLEERETSAERGRAPVGFTS